MLEIPQKKTLLERINEVSKAAGYKVSPQKFAAFLLTNSEQTGKTFKK